MNKKNVIRTSSQTKNVFVLLGQTTNAERTAIARINYNITVFAKEFNY